MKDIETNEKIYHRVVEQNSHLKVVKTNIKPDYSENEIKSLNVHLKKCKQKISFLTLANKAATSLQEYSCKTAEEAKEAGLIYDEIIIDYCLPRLKKISNIKLETANFIDIEPQYKEVVWDYIQRRKYKEKVTEYQKTLKKEEVSEYRKKLMEYQKSLKKYKIDTPSFVAWLAESINSIPDHILAEFYIDEQIISINRQTLNEEEIYNYYSNFIKNNTVELDIYSDLLKTLKKIQEEVSEILKDKTKLLPSPHILNTISQGEEKNISLGNYYTMAKRKLDIEDLTLALRKFSPNIYNEKLTKYTQQELEDFILENSQEIITYIDGAKLTILEDRAFCALRYLAVEAVDKKLVTTPDSEITVTPADIYKLAGIPYTEESGYDTKQRLAIKDAITNDECNLRKAIHIEVPQNHKDGYAISSTNFITRVNWNDEKNQVIYRIESLFFVNFEKKQDYWCDDVIGRIRLMKSLDQGFKNEKLYRLHKYLASCLGKKATFNVIKLLERSGLIKEFNNRKKKEALSKLQEYLDLMYEQKTLLKNKPIKINSKSDKYGKYELERL